MITAAELQVKFSSQGADKVRGDMDAVGNSVDKTESRTASLSNTFRNTGTWLTAGLTAPLAGFFTKAFTGAASLEQAQGKVDAVFKNSAHIITDWAKTTADSLGITETQALQFTGTLGNFYISAGLGTEQAAKMSKEMITLAADVSAFNDVSQERASQAIISAYAGEYDALQTLGININAAKVEQEAMNLAIADGRDEITEADKAQAIHNLIMKESANQHGQFKREADGASGSIARLRARFSEFVTKVGQQLLPTGTKIANMLLDWVEALHRISPAMLQWGVIIGVALAALGPLLIAISAMLPALGALGAAFGLLLGPVGLVAAAVVGLVIAWRTNFLGIRDIVGSVIDFVSGKITFLINVFNNLRAVGLSPAHAALQTLATVFPILASVIAPLRQVVDHLADSFGALKAGDISGALDHAGKAAKNLVSAGRNLTRVLATLARRATDFAQIGLDRLVDHLKSAFPSLASTIDRLGSALSSALSMAGSLASSLIAALSGDWSGAWTHFRDAAASAFDFVLNAARVVPTLIRDLFRAIDWGSVWEGITNAWDAIPWGTMASTALDLIVSGISAGAGAAGNLWGWLTDSLSTAISSMQVALNQGISLAWDMITSLDWSDYISDFAWEAWATILDWGSFILGKIADFGGWLADKVSDIPWSSIVGKIDDFAAWLANKVSDIPWASIVGKIEDLGAWLADKVSDIPWASIVGKIEDLGTWLADKVSDIPWSTILGKIADLGEWLADKVSDIPWSTILGKIEDLGAWLADKVSDIPWSTILGSIEDLGAWLADKVSDIPWASILGSIEDLGAWLADKVSDIPWSSIIGKIADFSKWLGDKVSDIPWSTIIGKIADFSKWLGDKVSDIPWSTIIGKIADFAQWLADKVSDIPWSTLIGKIEDFGAWLAGIVSDIPWPSSEDILGAIPWPDMPEFEWPSVGDIKNWFLEWLGGSSSAAGQGENGEGTGGGSTSGPGGGNYVPVEEQTGGGGGNAFAGDWSQFPGMGGGLAGAGASIAQMVRDALAEARAAVQAGVTELQASMRTGADGAVQAAGAAFALLPPTVIPPIASTTANIGANAGAWASTIGMNTGAVVANVASNFGLIPGTVAPPMAAALASVSSSTSGMQVASTSNLGTMASNAASQLASMLGSVTSTFTSIRSTASSNASQAQSQVTSHMNTMRSQSTTAVAGMQAGIAASMLVMRSSAVSNAQSAADGVASALSSGALRAVSLFRSAMSTLPGIISSVGGAAAGTASAVGANIGNALAAGIRSAYGAVAAAAAALVAQADIAMRARAMIASPSKRGIWIGEMIGIAPAIGIKNKTRDVVRAASDYMGAVMNAMHPDRFAPLGVAHADALSPMVARPYGNAGSVVINDHRQFNVTQLPGEDGESLARRLIDMMETDYDAAGGR